MTTRERMRTTYGEMGACGHQTRGRSTQTEGRWATVVRARALRDNATTEGVLDLRSTNIKRSDTLAAATAQAVVPEADTRARFHSPHDSTVVNSGVGGSQPSSSPYQCRCKSCRPSTTTTTTKLIGVKLRGHEATDTGLAYAPVS